MDSKTREESLKRLAIVEGHIKKVRQMVLENSYCPLVIHQIQAVQSALAKTNQIILYGHLHTCVLDDLHSGTADNEKLIKEIVEIFDKAK